MDLILPFLVKKPTLQINISDPILLMGSCFAEEIGLKLKERRFNTLVNPHGILFNPLSLAQAMNDYNEKRKYGPKDIFPANELWHSFKHHGAFSNTDPALTLRHINSMIGDATSFLAKAKWLIVTFGSAFVYKHNPTGQFVGNCHKVPSKEFEKILLKKEDVVGCWKDLADHLHTVNPALQIIFTVSPVRYVRDGLEENNRSKGILLDSVHSLTEQIKNCHYFPAYEIVIDVLRDYRFFKEDMVHPNEQAVNYVWEKFTENYCDLTTQDFLKEYEPILYGMRHRSLHEGTESEKKFREQLKTKVQDLEKKFLS